MPESDPLQILAAHDRWATEQLLDACGRLAPEQLHKRFDIGPGSLHDTITHILGVMRVWTETLTGAEPRPRLEADGQRRTPEQFRAILDDASRALAIEARRLPLEEPIVRHTADGRTLRMTRGAVLTHVATHGVHHRAQCLNMLRQLGVSPLPPSSVAEWTLLVDKQA